MSYFKVYIINGSGGSGKDTFCDLVWTAMDNFLIVLSINITLLLPLKSGLL